MRWLRCWRIRVASSSLNQAFFDLHAEVTAAFLDMGEDLVAVLAGEGKMR